MTTAHEITTCKGKGRARSERTLMVSLNRLFMTVLLALSTNRLRRANPPRLSPLCEP